VGLVLGERQRFAPEQTGRGTNHGEREEWRDWPARPKQVAITIPGRRKRRKLWIRVDKLTGWQF
jgi:hypothetical protein